MMMWRGRTLKAEVQADNRRKILLWATLAGLVFGLLGIGQPLDDFLRAARNVLRSEKVSGDIVIVGIDDKSLQTIHGWPWPLAYHAQLIDHLRALGARRIMFGVGFPNRSDARDTAIFVQALQRAGGQVVLPTRFLIDDISRRRTEFVPAPELRPYVRLANINVRYNSQSAVWKLPYAMQFKTGIYPSLASELAVRTGEPGAMFPIDYGIDLRSIPAVSAVDIISDKVDRRRFAGKDVVIGLTSQQLGDSYFVPGRGYVSPAYLHVVGAETLKQGTPVDLGWFPALIVVAMVGGIHLFSSRRLVANLLLNGCFAALIGLPLLAESHHIFFDVIPAFILLIVVMAAHAFSRLRKSYSARGITNAISGLPNLNALRLETPPHNSALVAMRIQNFAEITSTLPQEMERALVEQIVKRIGLGTGDLKLFQGDEGVFLWLLAPDFPAPVSDHLEALHALFRSPIVIPGRQVDLAVTFGVDADSGRSLINRIGSALVAANEAASEGAKWKEYDPAKLKDAAWKLSLLSQLDAAIDSGEVWVAFQPKIDLSSHHICGAEALVRWSHPEKGNISPEEFVVAAEQHNRIEKLTAYVLHTAIRFAAQVNRRGIEFEMAVNLSARLLDSPLLIEMIKGSLAEHGLAARHLVLEVTETAAMSSSGWAIDMFQALRDLGVGISIDDYGTGFSTLEYLKKIPANEIKIDRSFVNMMDRSNSDRLLVHSTIQLAHSLGRQVVAEGVETQEALDELCLMGCDKAQGYLIGRPMRRQTLSKLVLKDRGRSAA